MFKNAGRKLLISGRQILAQQRRNTSALYITGDKAMENYVTLRPYLDFEETLIQIEKLKYSVEERRMKVDLESVLQKYNTFKDMNNKIQLLEKKREDVAKKLKDLMKSNVGTSEECNQLKEQGKILRNLLKTSKESFYPIEDEFVHEFLSLPNELHQYTPSDNFESVLHTGSAPFVKLGRTHLVQKDLIRFIDVNQYYLMKNAAEFDMNCTQALTRLFINKGKFTPFSNPDFVRSVLLEANGTFSNQYHMVQEQNLQNKLNTAFLTGGAAFESFLGAVTKLCIYPSVLPMRFVSCGRSYECVDRQLPDGTIVDANLFTATQTNAVQLFTAMRFSAEADEMMENILNFIVNFLETLGIHFRIVYVDASLLTLAECVRAEIQVYAPAERRYICIGQVSNFSNFISKRVLFSVREEKNHHFLHMVGGPILYTTRLLAAMIENDIELKNCTLLGSIQTDNDNVELKNYFQYEEESVG